MLSIAFSGRQSKVLTGGKKYRIFVLSTTDKLSSDYCFIKVDCWLVNTVSPNVTITKNRFITILKAFESFQSCDHVHLCFNIPRKS